MLATPEINFRRTPVTLILAAIAVALEVVCTMDPARRLYYYYDVRLGINHFIWLGELWRPFTSTLLHGNLIHAAFNVYWLATFGSALENRFGPSRTLGLIVLLGYVSMLPQFVIGDFVTYPPTRIVGLSGIVYGLFGIVLVGRRYRPEFEAVCSSDTVKLLVGWFVLCIVLTRLDIMRVANIAHGAGLLFGMVYGLVAFDVRRRLRWALLASVATALVLSTMIVCPGHAGYEVVQEYRQFRQALENVPQPAPKKQSEQ